MAIDMSDEAQAKRAAIRRKRAEGGLVDKEADASPVGRTLSERLELVFSLSEWAWKLSGRPFPEYARSEIPGLLIRAESTS